MLQRGLGSGYLWAIEHPVDARPLILECVSDDPRWDRQLESRTSFYAEISRAIGITGNEFAPLLDRLADETVAPCEESVENDLPIGLTCSLALSGDPEARLIAEHHVRETTLSECFRARLEESEIESWPTLRELLDQPPTELDDGEDEEDRPEANRSQSTAELLHHPDWWRASQILATRTARKDLDLVRDAVASDDVRVRGIAYRALAGQGDTSVTVAAGRELIDGRGVALSGARVYLKSLPAELALSIARDWIGHGEYAQEREAWSLLALHAEIEDLPIARANLIPSLEQGEIYTVCNILEALARHPSSGPHPEAIRCFREIPYARARRRVMRLLEASDPAGLQALAPDARWDCESEVREIAERALGDRSSSA